MLCYSLSEVSDANVNDRSKMISIVIDRQLKERAESFFQDNPGTTYSTILDLFLTREGYPASK